MKPFWREFVMRLGIAAILLVTVNLVAGLFWTPNWFTYWQVPLSCLVFICFLGVLLYDTLFRERPR